MLDLRDVRDDPMLLLNAEDGEVQELLEREIGSRFEKKREARPLIKAGVELVAIYGEAYRMIAAGAERFAPQLEALSERLGKAWKHMGVGYEYEPRWAVTADPYGSAEPKGEVTAYFRPVIVGEGILYKVLGEVFVKLHQASPSAAWCEFCRELFLRGRADQRYCSDTCRAQASQRRQREEAGVE